MKNYKNSFLAKVQLLLVAAIFLLVGCDTSKRSGNPPLDLSKLELSDCGIIRGPTDKKQIALVFTGHTFGEGGAAILSELAKHHAKASFFLTGVFLRNEKFKPVVERIVADGHYLGPHSDQHLLYCPWSGPKTNLISREAFSADLQANLKEVRKLAGRKAKIDYWLPAYEWYNCDVVKWSREDCGVTLINFTPGTRSNADYIGETEKNFVSSQTIFDSILKKERTDPNGLNGYFLLMHIGVGDGRTDKFFDRLSKLLDDLQSKGYQCVRVDELLPRASL